MIKGNSSELPFFVLDCVSGVFYVLGNCEVIFTSLYIKNMFCLDRCLRKLLLSI